MASSPGVLVRPASPVLVALEVCLPRLDAAIKQCAYSKCGIEFAPPRKGQKAKCCCDDHRRLYQDEKRKAERSPLIVARRAWDEGRYRDITQEFDSRTHGEVRAELGRYRLPARREQEYLDYLIPNLIETGSMCAWPRSHKDIGDVDWKPQISSNGRRSA